MPVDPGLLLRHGLRHEWPDGGVSTLNVDVACHLACPSGRIGACDMNDLAGEGVDYSAHELLSVASGSYQVLLATAEFPPNEAYPDGFGRVAAAALTFSDAPISTWTRLKQRLQIDHGTACLFDVANHSELSAVTAHRRWDDRITIDVIENRVATRPLGVVPAPFVAFECGMGAGGYELWLGRDEAGAPSKVLFDLELLDHGRLL